MKMMSNTSPIPSSSWFLVRGHSPELPPPHGRGTVGYGAVSAGRSTALMVAVKQDALGVAAKLPCGLQQCWATARTQSGASRHLESSLLGSSGSNMARHTQFTRMKNMTAGSKYLFSCTTRGQCDAPHRSNAVAQLWQAHYDMFRFSEPHGRIVKLVHSFILLQRRKHAYQSASRKSVARPL